MSALCSAAAARSSRALLQAAPVLLSHWLHAPAAQPAAAAAGPAALATLHAPQQHHQGPWLLQAPLLHSFSTTRSSSSEPDAKPPGDQQQQQQQQQQQESEASKPSKQQQHKESEAAAMSKSFLSGKLSQEELWMAGLGGRLKIWALTNPELKDPQVQKDVVGEAWEAYYDLLQTHSQRRMLTNQARAQLKLACLAVASYRVLLPLAGGEGGAAAVERHIGESMGSLYAPFMLGSLKLTAWVRKLLLAQSPMKMAGSTLRDIAKDMEGACDVEVDEEEGGQGYELKVDSCMFQQVLSKEQLPQLLAFFCCQHNASWLEAYRQHGVAYRLSRCMARGDDCCLLEVKPSSSSGGGGSGGAGGGSSSSSSGAKD